MELFVDICSFLGAWFLVAGPLYQASLELREEDIQTERIHNASSQIEPPQKASAWWWLFPPAKLFIQMRRNKVYRDEYLKILNPEDVEALMRFMNKATGWLIVASGATFIAIKETYELTEELRSPLFIFWLALPFLILLCIGYTVQRTSRTKKVTEKIYKP